MASSFISKIAEALKRFFECVKNLVKKVINGILNFFKEIVNYFKSLRLIKNKDIPFIANPEQFKDMIKNAPVKNVGIFEATYNEETKEIENARYLAADEVDEQTKEVLGNEQLVVLN